jgi:hypothetical protein
MGMPPASVDPDRLRSLGAALGPLRQCAGEGAEEVLTEFPELGDRETQMALDGWVEQLADLLREIEATGSDLSGRLRVAALNAGGPQASAAHGQDTRGEVAATGDARTSTTSGEGFR